MLVVDDDLDTVNTTALETKFVVLTATSGDDALKIARAERPAAIILDVMMGDGRDGFVIFGQLRADQATWDIPVVFHTSVNKEMSMCFDARVVGKHLGSEPDAFLEKPVPPAKLLKVVAGVIDGAGGPR